jgi:hypothetical protein
MSPIRSSATLWVPAAGMISRRRATSSSRPASAQRMWAMMLAAAHPDTARNPGPGFNSTEPYGTRWRQRAQFIVALTRPPQPRCSATRGAPPGAG